MKKKEVSLFVASMVTLCVFNTSSLPRVDDNFLSKHLPRHPWVEESKPKRNGGIVMRDTTTPTEEAVVHTAFWVMEVEPAITYESGQDFVPIQKRKSGFRIPDIDPCVSNPQNPRVSI